MEIIKRSVTKYLLFVALFTILVVFDSNKVLANEGALTPKGYIDTPLNGASLKEEVVLSGWFLDPNGISKVEILVDGRSVGQAQYGEARMDVYNAYPEYQNQNSGYKYTIDTKTIPNGPHTLAVRATSTNGETNVTGNVSVNVQNVQNSPSRGYIDSPLNGSTVKGETVVRGWFLDASGVSNIEVLVDGKSVGQAQYGELRTDVNNLYPEYNNLHSGFNFTLNTKNLTNGTHTLTIKGTGSNGGVTVIGNVLINVVNDNLQTKGYIDSPVHGSTVKGETVVRGWFLDGSGVSKIEVLVDGRYVGEATYGEPRLDVAKAYPQYNNPNSGYKFVLDTKSLGNGNHTITIRETGNDGSKTEVSKQILVENLVVIGSLDNPLNQTIVKGEVNVRGWFLDASGVSKVEVLVDGKYIGQAQYGLDRPDVKKAYPQYQNGNAGYQYTLNTFNLSNGEHKLTIRETSNNGTIKDITNVINVQNLAVIGTVDEPVNGSTVRGDITVRGWFLDSSGVSKVEVLVDGKYIGQAQYGLDRPDVKKAYPQYQNGNAGYQYTLNTMNLTNGQHQLTIRETGKNGAVKDISKVINVNNIPVIGSIDNPLNGSTVKGNITVRGWFLDASGVSKIEVLVDGKYMGEATYGSPRPDVAKVYPEHQNSNSGYEYTLSTKDLTNGKHTLTIREIGKNGAKKEISNVVTVNNLSTIGSIDSPSNKTTVYGEIPVRGWFLDDSGVSKIEVFLNGVKIGDAAYGTSRPDVAKAFPGYNNSNSGYTFTLNTEQFADGTYNLTVKETGKNGGTASITYIITIYNGNYLSLDLRKPSNITANDIVNFFKNSAHPDSILQYFAQNFIDAQTKYGINAQYLVAHTIWETGWGKSNLALYKNNYFGYGAYDPCPFTCGYYYPTGADSINYEAYIVRNDYLNENGKWYNGPNLIGMNVKYATDQNWKNGIANLMQRIKAFDPGYYSQVGIMQASNEVPASTFGRDIPDGKPYPESIVVNYTTDTYATVTTSLSFRTLPYTSSSTMMFTLLPGTVVKVIGYNTDVKSNGAYPYDQRWYRVMLNGQVGWVYGGGITFN